MNTNNNKIIIDASVIIAGIFDEPTKEPNGLQKMFKSAQLVAPELLKYEVNNTLGNKISHNLIRRNEIQASFLMLPIKYLIPSIEDLKLAQFLQFSTKDSFYDTTYHAMAILRGINFYTLDKRYHKRAKRYGYVKLVN